MTEMIYEYDGSFEGFLTCIFESYAQKEVLTAISCGRRRRRTCCAAAFSPACRTGKCTCTVWW